VTVCALAWRAMSVSTLAVVTGCAATTSGSPAGGRQVARVYCAPDTHAVVHQLRYTLGRLRDDPEWSFLKMYLPVRDSMAIRLVMNETVCRRAAEVYTAASGDTARAGRRRVTVVQAGDRWVIDDPFTPDMAGEWALRLIVDHDWKVLARLGT
jgi:hypothetical protein